MTKQRLLSRHSRLSYLVVPTISRGLYVCAPSCRTLLHDDVPSTLAVEQLNDAPSARDAHPLRIPLDLVVADCSRDICPRPCSSLALFLHRFYALSGISCLDFYTTQHSSAANL
jgi:hypothetical protein